MGLLDDSQAVEFSSHPAYACRFREHLRLLKRLGWWSEIYRTKAEQMGLIAHLAALPESRYKLAPETDLRQEFITAFLTIRLHIRRVVDKVCLGVPSGISGFRQYRLHIKEYLSHGVVPSSLSIKERMHHPDPVAVLNAAFCYYLEGLPRFIVPRTTTERRSELNRRVDMWAAKAVDDYKLLRAVRES